MWKRLLKPFRRRAAPGSSLEQLLALVGEQGQPNFSGLRVATRNIDPMCLSIKQFGYTLARQLAEALPPLTGTAARHVGLRTSLSTQVDLESDWVAHWCSQIGVPVVYHRKLWELAYVLQGIYEHGGLRAGARGLGFGCGTEPIPSYLAAHDIAVTMTDLPSADAAAQGWIDTNQHVSTRDQSFHAHLVDRARFDRLVSLRAVDMNAIPADLGGFDFCWSICALEHLGSIARGMDFIVNSLATLRPGGVSVHTTEFNISEVGPTVDNWPTVLFQRGHIEELAARLEAQGHYVTPINLALGDRPMDRFVDVPPWPHDLPDNLNDWLGPPAHLKLVVDGFVCTCLGLIVVKAE